MTKYYPITEKGTQSEMAVIKPEAINVPHVHCKKCGQALWFGLVQFKKSESWVPYHVYKKDGMEKILDGNGYMLLERHRCMEKRTTYIIKKCKVYGVRFALSPSSNISEIKVDGNETRTTNKKLAEKSMEEYYKSIVLLIKDKFPDYILEIFEEEKEIAA